jgi:hypothetical protein
MTHNAFNQINARSPGGTLMVKGALTQPSKVTVGLSGQAGKEAEYPSPNKFRGYVSGVTASTSGAGQDNSLTLTTANRQTGGTGWNEQQNAYTVSVKGDAQRTFQHDADGNLTRKRKRGQTIV